MFPDSPRIKLRNYLYDLVSDKDSKENSLYLINISEFIKKIWQEIIKCEPKLCVRTLIPKKFNISVGLFYNYKNGKKAVPIQFVYELLQLWKNLCNKTEHQVNKKWDEFFELDYKFVTHSKCQQTKLPKYITPKLAYLLGWLCGDGHFKEAHNYVIKISEKSTKQLEKVLKPLIKDLFAIDVPIFKRYMGGYAIQFGSKAIYRFLKKVLKIDVGKIPSFAKDLDYVNKRYFLMGIFDSEGCILKNRHRVVIAQSKKDFLLKVSKLSADIGVCFQRPILHKSKLGKWYTIRIDSKKDFITFAHRIGSKHVDKLKLIEKWVSEIENRNS
jgi:hypothetical protein